jgi:NADP-dependent 3-hydroxy acid dehydrogenase YdfG
MSRPVAIVAGAGAAGAATALAMSAAGYSVVVLDSRAESAQRAVDPVLAAGGEAWPIAVDLLDADAVAALRESVLAELGRIDVLVHLVGGWRGSRTLDRESADNWALLAPPIVGTLAVLTGVLGEDVRSSPIGRVIMVSSTAAAKPTAGNIAYAAAKSAAESWMAGVAHFLRDSQAASVILAVKALLNDSMTREDPAKEWPGYTHVDDLAAKVAWVCTNPVDNGVRLDLTIDGSIRP